MQDEILVKGKDGKLYILRGDELVPYETGTSAPSRFHDQPKGVSKEEHERFEGKTTEIGTQTAQKIEPQKLSTENTELKKLSVRSVSTSLVVSHEDHPLKVELEEIVEGVVKNIMEQETSNMEQLKDTVLSKRFRMIVSARLREVRDAMETREMLVRSVKIGGLGIRPPLNLPLTPTPLPKGEGRVRVKGEKEEVEQMMEIIEKAFAEFQSKWREVEEKRKIEWKKKQAERWEAGEGKKKAEEVDLEERYKRLTGLTGEISKSQLPITKEIPKPKTQSLEATREAKSSRPAVPVEDKMKEKKMLMPPPPMVVKPQKLSTENTEFKNPSVRFVSTSLVVSCPAKLTDVRKAPQLLGPMEELSALTLPDFRRLAKDPREGTVKILGKIEFLGKESLVRKTQAKEAWYKSPLYQEYSQIMRKAFAQRKGPLTILESGQSTLTKDEWYAIMELNQKLRF